jgi:hypothetical protein
MVEFGTALRLLNGRFSLLDIDDVEALCQDIANRSGLELQYHQRESLLTYLIEECWRLSGRYEEGRGSTTSFAGWATTNLRLRVTDWARIEFGRTTWAFKDRTYERPRPVVHSLDVDGAERDLLGTSLAAGSVDDGAFGTAAELRSLDARAIRPRGRNRRLDYDST